MNHISLSCIYWTISVKVLSWWASCYISWLASNVAGPSLRNCWRLCCATTVKWLLVYLTIFLCCLDYLQLNSVVKYEWSRKICIRNERIVICFKVFLIFYWTLQKPHRINGLMNENLAGDLSKIELATGGLLRCTAIYALTLSSHHVKSRFSSCLWSWKFHTSEALMSCLTLRLPN
jgi:hypothetical protein